MTLLHPGVDYTDLDFDSIRLRLIGLVKESFPEWTDFAVASFGNILLEMYALVGDVLSYYLNAQARESRLATATQRKNVIVLARMPYSCASRGCYPIPEQMGIRARSFSAKMSRLKSLFGRELRPLPMRL